MKKLIIILVLVTVSIVIIFGGAIAITKSVNMDRGERKIKELSEYTGMEYLGLINTDAVSKKDGYVYNGPAIAKEALKRAGLPEESDVWTIFVDEYSGVSIMKMTVYAPGQEDVSLFKKKVLAEYLYGEV